MITKHKQMFPSFFLVLIICIVFGALTRIAYCIKYPVQPRDSYKYEITTETWNKDNSIDSEIYRFPLTQTILGIPNRLTGMDILKGGIIVNLIIGLFAGMMISIIAKEIFKNNFIALFAGLCFMTHPKMIKYSCEFLRENIYLFFSCCFIYFLIRYWKTLSVFTVVLSGIFTVLAFMSRLEGVELFIYFCIVQIVLLLNKTIGLKKTAMDSTVFFATNIIVFLATSYIIGIKLYQIESISRYIMSRINYIL